MQQLAEPVRQIGRVRVSVVRARDHWFLVVCLLIPVAALTAALCAGTFSFFGN